MTIEDVLKKLKGYIYSEFGTAKKYAEHKGVSPAHVSAILRGEKPPTKNILSDIGITEKIVTTTYK